MSNEGKTLKQQLEQLEREQNLMTNECIRLLEENGQLRRQNIALMYEIVFCALRK